MTAPRDHTALLQVNGIGVSLSTAAIDDLRPEVHRGRWHHAAERADGAAVPEAQLIVPCLVGDVYALGWRTGQVHAPILHVKIVDLRPLRGVETAIPDGLNHIILRQPAGLDHQVTAEAVVGGRIERKQVVVVVRGKSPEALPLAQQKVVHQLRAARVLADLTAVVVKLQADDAIQAGEDCSVFDRESLTALSRFVTQHNLILVCDQAFEDFIFDGREFITPAALPGMWERTVSVFSLSKGYGLSGLRVGYLVADDRIMDTFYGSAVNVIGATNTAAQAGALTAFKHPEILMEYHERLLRRRDMAFEAFSGIPGVGVRPAESGFLSWLDVSALGETKAVVSYLTQNARVLVNDGAAYGRQGAGHIRIVHGCFRDDDQARDALLRIRQALIALAEDSI